MKSDFDALFERLAESYVRVGRPERILAAFSGGADSTALLLLLQRLKNETGVSVMAAHVNHGLRESAERDEGFCRKTCGELGIPFVCVRLSLPSADENTARAQRYSALLSIAVKAGCGHIALAHHMRDQAETLLMRLMRGSVDGLGGMAESTSVCYDGHQACIWRPFLGESPETLKQMLCSSDRAWVEDETNRTDVYLRNFIRLRILPELEKRQAKAAEHIANTAGLLREEGDYLNACAVSRLRGHAHFGDCCPFIEAGILDQSPLVMRRRMIRHFLLRHGVRPESAQLCAAAGLAAGGVVNLPGGGAVRKTRRYLHLQIPRVRPEPAPLIKDPAAHTGDGKRSQAFPASALEGAELRYRRPGDRIIPFGMQREKSLQDYLVDRKTEAPFRDYLPLLCRDSQVLWVIGVGSSELGRVLPGMDAVLLSYDGFLPGRADYQGE